MSFLLFFMSSLQQSWRRGQNRFCLEAMGVGGRRRGWGSRREKKGVGEQEGEMAQTMYAHMNK
jgi:hypothetical protein